MSLGRIISIKPIKKQVRPIFTFKGLFATTAIFAIGLKRPEIMRDITVITLASVGFVYIWDTASTILEPTESKEEE